MNSDYSFIKTRRKELKMTQQQLAKQVGVTSAYIQQLENNVKKHPSFEVFLKIIKALNLNIDDIMGVKEDWENMITKDGRVKNLHTSEYVDSLNKLSKAIKSPINKLLNVPPIDDEMLSYIDKDNKLRDYKEYLKNNIESIENNRNSLKLLADELGKYKESEEYYKPENLRKVSDIINNIPKDSWAILDFVQNYDDTQAKKYENLYLIKEKLIDIVKILNYDTSNLSDDFFNSLVKVIIRTIDFEIFNKMKGN